jgi:SAM-dependent methyltransferase
MSPESPAKGSEEATCETVPGRILNLGSGLRRLPGVINVDIVADTGPDVVHDLNLMPWPFPTSYFQEVHAYDVLEHLDDFLAVMREINRVAADGAVVKITVPHFSCSNAFTDPTHKHFFSWFSFHYVTGENDYGFYSSLRFKRRFTTLIFQPTLLNKIVRRLANHFPGSYERRWAWLFPAWYLYFELEVVKPDDAATTNHHVES